MIKERYVSSEVAMLLRDKGFNEGCNAIYGYDNNLHTNIFTCHNSEFEGCVTAPTQARACDWVEEKYKLHIVVRFVSKYGYIGSVCDISNPDNTSYVANTRNYSSIEQVYNEVLKYILTTMI